jgi:hypothetical protein
LGDVEAAEGEEDTVEPDEADLNGAALIEKIEEEDDDDETEVADVIEDDEDDE